MVSQGWGKCLNNRPSKLLEADDVLPGIIFDLDEQCRLAVGPYSSSCFLNDEPPMVDRSRALLQSIVYQSL